MFRWRLSREDFPAAFCALHSASSLDVLRSEHHSGEEVQAFGERIFNSIVPDTIVVRSKNGDNGRPKA